MARALYTNPPTEQESAALGLTVEEATEQVELWPDHVDAANVMAAMSTQWTVGPGGPVGLVYASLPEVWRRMKVPPGKRDQVFSDIRIMEDEAMNVMRGSNAE